MKTDNLFKDTRIYGLRNKETGEWWIAGSGKYKWFRAQDVKNAFHRWEKEYFKDQNLWEIIEFKLILVDQKEKMNNKYYRKRLGLKYIIR